jgi:AcrR family transcriptional regulator
MATTTRTDQQRARVLEATIAAIADVGVDGLTMSDISKRAGMTPGHILYYFGRKERILIETLRWSEHDLAEGRRPELDGLRDPRARLHRLVDLYLPQGPADARWNLWLQVGVHPPSDEETLEQLELLLDLWVDDLVALLRDGIEEDAVAEPALDLAQVARRGLWFLDGLSLSLLSGSPRLTRADAIEIGVEELERWGLTPASGDRRPA